MPIKRRRPSRRNFELRQRWHHNARYHRRRAGMTHRFGRRELTSDIRTSPTVRTRMRAGAGSRRTKRMQDAADRNTRPEPAIKNLLDAGYHDDASDSRNRHRSCTRARSGRTSRHSFFGLGA